MATMSFGYLAKMDFGCYPLLDVFIHLWPPILAIFVFHGSGFSKCPAVLLLHAQVLHDHVTIRDVNAQRLILDLPSAICILATAVASVNKPKQLLVLPSL
ncbi:hypothetical protein Pelo_4248 [Pelomyxa schiedti]|nr:hypothetical protein Pelo_4248 [Pelomyxa schiedti]